MKRIFAVVLFIALAFGFTGCGSAPVSSSISSRSSASSENSSEVSAAFDPSEKAIALCMGSIEHPVYKIVQLGFIEGAQTIDSVTPIVSGLDEGSISELIEKWNADITKNNVAGVAVWVGDDSCYDLLKEWSKLGIKTVVPFFEHSYADTNEFIGANLTRDQYAMGVSTADFLVETLEENGITRGSLGVTENGTSAINYANIGFRSRIAELETGFTLLDTAFEGEEATQATVIVQDYINRNPTMVGAFGCAGGSANSWSMAKANTGREDITVVTFDYIVQNLDILTAGGVEALIAQPLYDSGYQSAVTLDMLLRGTVFDESSWNIDLGFNLITEDGEGVNGLDYYYNLYARSEALDWNKYLT